MRNAVLPVLVMVFIIATTVLHSKKTSKEYNEIDKIQTALTDLKPIITRNGGISYSGVNTGNEMRFWIKYALAPAYISVNSPISDSILTICPLQFLDSAMALARNRGKIVWQKKDDQYAYIYTTAR